MSPELQPMVVQYYCHVSPSLSRDQYTAQWREFWSRDTDVYLTYIHFGIILTILTILSISRDRNILCLKCIVQLLRFSGFNLYPLSSPFKVPLRNNIYTTLTREGFTKNAIKHGVTNWGWEFRGDCTNFLIFDFLQLWTVSFFDTSWSMVT